jgi:hypothetical protein
VQIHGEQPRHAHRGEHVRHNKFEFVRRIGNHWFYKPKS